jgi:radical SAM superfamily enzyme YgiQ (UPF0313 family)
MRYEGTVYRPPSEAHSLLIQATIGCPHNKCTFCSMYKDVRFRLRPVTEIKEDLDAARTYYGPHVRSLFFPDGNTIILKTDDLVDILEHTRRLFPYLERITVYGAARYINKKSAADLRRLKEAGLNRIHSGMESGDDEVLARLCKGVTAEEIIRAGLKLKEAEIETSQYYLTGAGGRELWCAHAQNSGKTLSAFSPDFIRIRTLRLIKQTPLYEQWQRGEFELPGPHDALRELQEFVEHLECDGTRVLSDHMLNYWDIQGALPADRPHMLNEIQKALQTEESLLARPFDGRL